MTAEKSKARRVSLYKFEVHRTLALRDPSVYEPIANSRAVAELARRLMGPIDHEVMLVVHLDGKMQPRGYSEAGRGGQSSCPVEPMQVFRAAIIDGASALVLVHNHPSGQPAPSVEDVTLTRALAEAAALLGMRILDHVILGDGDSHFSMLDANLMP